MRLSAPTSTDRRRRLTELLDAHGEKLYATLVRLTLRRGVAADLLQDLFVRLSSDAFDRAFDPAAYAWRVAINLAMEWRRGRRWPAAADVDVVAPEPSPLSRMVRAEEMERLLDALEDVSDAQREAFVLRMIEQQTCKQAAARMQRTPHQVRGLCHAATRHLQEKFAKERMP